jgi:hypothetical protein
MGRNHDDLAELRAQVCAAYHETAHAAKMKPGNRDRLGNLPWSASHVMFGARSRFEHDYKDTRKGDVAEHDYTRGSIWTDEHPWYGVGSLAWKRSRCVGRWKMVDGRPVVTLMLWGRKI